MTKEKVLFISDKSFIDYTTPGGVQLCTHEFIEYLTIAGYELEIIKVYPVISLIKRIQRRLHIESYELYDCRNWLGEIIDTVNKNDIKLVFFNQINLAHWAKKIKPEVSSEVRFIGLSHGNESGDYLHDITQSAQTSLLKTWRLGKLITKEKAIFSDYLDGVIVISNNDYYIDQWLGAQKVLYLPRILKPDVISWEPIDHTIGFVGTLNHLPNKQGIERVADELKKLDFNGQFIVVGGPRPEGQALQQKYSFIQYRGALSPAQLREEVSRWCIFINPVFWYARGSSTKLTQAINWGLPVVSTLAGIRGYELTDNSLSIGNNLPETFAGQVMDLLTHKQLLMSLKQASEKNAGQFAMNKWAALLSDFLKNIA